MSAGVPSPFEMNLDAFLGPRMTAQNASPSAQRTLLLVGHLPVMSGLWLSQYADREARAHGAICLVRLEHDAVQLELFRAGARRPTITSQSTLPEALRAIAPIVSTWMIVPRTNDMIEIPEGTASTVILTGADDPAVLAAYELVKRCMASIDARTSIGTRPSISVTVLGADSDTSAQVGGKLRAVAQRFLDIELPVDGGLQRVAPVESAFRGTFDAPSPTLAQIYALMSEAEAAPIPARTTPTASHGGVSARPTVDAKQPVVGERFGPRAERRGPTSSVPPRSRNEAPIPFHGSLPPTPIAALPRVEAASAASATAATRIQPRAKPPLISVDELIEARARIESASAERVALRKPGAACASTKSEPAVESASLPPLPVVVGEARMIESNLPEPLAKHIEGLAAFPFRAPSARAVEIACDAAGLLHVVGRREDLGALLEVRDWIRDHAEILRAAHPACDPATSAAINIVYPSFTAARPIEGARSYVLMLVEVAGRCGYLAQRVHG